MTVEMDGLSCIQDSVHQHNGQKQWILTRYSLDTDLDTLTSMGKISKELATLFKVREHAHTHKRHALAFQFQSSIVLLVVRAFIR